MSTLQLVCFYWRILGLCPYVFSNSKVVRLCYTGPIYAIILSVSYTVCYLRAIKNRTTYSLPRESPMSVLADVGGLSIEFGLIVLSWLYFGFSHKKVQQIVSSFAKIHESYEPLAIHNYNAKILRDVKLHMIVVNLAFYILCIADNLLLLKVGYFGLEIWLPFNIPRIVTHNISLMFADTMRAIQQRLRLLNEDLQGLPKVGATRMIIQQKFEPRMNDSSEHLKSLASPEPLQVYGQLHSDLIDLTKIVVDFFSPSILFIILTHVIQMSAGLYAMCLVVKSRKFWPLNDVASFAILGSWFIVHLTQISILMFVSDSTAREGNRTGNILHKMMLGRRTERYNDSAKIMSLRLLQQQLKIKLFSMFKMKPEIIHTIMGMVLTYITIMMQLDDQEERMK